MNLKIALSLLAPALILASPVSAATMHYDCSKAGNANKTACKKAAPAPKAAAAKPAKTTKPVTVAAAKPAAMSKAAPKKAAPQVAEVDNKDPKGATAKCKDGMYSHSKTHAGACSRHGGVASWI